MNRIVGLLFVAVMWSACSGALVPPKLLKEAEQGAPIIALIKSRQNAHYDLPAAMFATLVKATVYEFVMLDNGDEPALFRAVSAMNPAMFVTLGGKASVFAAANFPDRPILTLMVINPHAAGIDKYNNVSSVMFETSPRQEFSQFKIALPYLKRVLVLYSPPVQAHIDQAKKDAAALGIELVAVAVDKARDVPAAFERLRDHFDALWVAADTALITQESFSYLRNATTKAHVPMLASLFESFADAGATIAVGVDLSSLGPQAASMTRSLLAQKSASKRVEPPIGTHLVLNLAVAKQLGVEVSSDVLPMVHRVIEQETPKESSR